MNLLFLCRTFILLLIEALFFMFFMFQLEHSRIHLGGIISEGYERGFIEVRPAPYNVVLEDDDTYKGEIKVGFKFFTKVRCIY